MSMGSNYSHKIIASYIKYSVHNQHVILSALPHQSPLPMRILLFLGLIILVSPLKSQTDTLAKKADILIIGGGTGGTAAGIAAARLGVKTLVVEEGPWLGGMISSAGVSCTDGNHNLASGIWNEFRERIYAAYGGPKAVATGLVSNTQFETHVSDSIWKSLAEAEKHPEVL